MHVLMRLQLSFYITCGINAHVLRQTVMELLRHILRPDEFYALLKYKLAGCSTTRSQCNFEAMHTDLKTCYDFLNQTSRSFAAVIQALDSELRDAVCIFYLVLRSLDTVEDDMSIPKETKIPMLKNFHKNLQNPSWCYLESQEKDKVVLEKFYIISSEFRKLAPVYQEVISEICAKMGEGMAIYIDRSPSSMKDWDEYCHYVAGLVGIGLSRLFSSSQLEDKIVGEDTRLSNSMGLFLQKANIIRDYLEDVVQGRHFWPKEAWQKYGRELVDFSKLENRVKGLHCLNELVTNALQHIPDVMEYMDRIKNQSIFNFCAIPQVMAIATLERCYNNPDVFEKVVKIRKGEAVKMIMTTSNMDSLKAAMKHFCTRIESRISPEDPSAEKTHSIIQYSLRLSATHKQFVSMSAYLPVYLSGSVLVAALLWRYREQMQDMTGKLKNHTLRALQHIKDIE